MVLYVTDKEKDSSLNSRLSFNFSIRNGSDIMPHFAHLSDGFVSAKPMIRDASCLLSLSEFVALFCRCQIRIVVTHGNGVDVCIVEKRGTGKLYAMKYMNKLQCIEKDALNNVLREVEILASLEHPFLVNLWFSFQDEEDLFMVSDLFMGGDLRYHIQQKVHFKEDCVRLYVLELALALEYLRSKSIVHRDVKPDNILLDEKGHAHLTDFNIATILREGQLATSMSGTKPYMAPEIFACATDECAGYNFAVDWWSLGICAYEMLALARPYDIHSMTSICEVMDLFGAPLPYPRHWSSGTVQLLSKLICVEPGARVSSLSELKTVPAITKLDISQVLGKMVTPSFTPPSDHLNCDPTLELEEMIVETKPLHKKKKRLAKQKSLQPMMSVDLGSEFNAQDRSGKPIEFLTYNREQELRRREMERREREWENELKTSMELCDLGGEHQTRDFGSHCGNRKNVGKDMKKSLSFTCCACDGKSTGDARKKQHSFDCMCQWTRDQAAGHSGQEGPKAEGSRSVKESFIAHRPQKDISSEIQVPL